MLGRAFDLALAGRPGPVLLDVPMDIQNTKLNVAEPPECLRCDEPLYRLIGRSGQSYSGFSTMRSDLSCWWVQVYVRETLSFRCKSS